jgi:hypothetical protein
MAPYGGERRLLDEVVSDGLSGGIGRVIWWHRTGYLVASDGLSGDNHE